MIKVFIAVNIDDQRLNSPTVAVFAGSDEKERDTKLFEFFLTQLEESNDDSDTAKRCIESIDSGNARDAARLFDSIWGTWTTFHVKHIVG